VAPALALVRAVRPPREAGGRRGPGRISRPVRPPKSTVLGRSSSARS